MMRIKQRGDKMVTYEIDLSVDADYMYSAPAMKQYDSESRQLRMRLFDRSGENIATKSGQKYRMRGLKPDGQPIYVKAETEGEHVVYTLDPQVLTAVGTVLMDVEILKADDESFLLSSQLIAIEVEPAALSHEKLKSDSVITAIAGIGADTIASERVIAAIAEKARKQEKLLDGIEAAEKARQQAEEGRATAEGKRAEGESARAAAESGRSTAEEERTKKEEERKGAESSRQEAEASRAEAERRRSESEKVRAGAEDIRANAESTRAAAESSRLDAEKARETAEEGRKAAESGRVDAESRRSDAETKRVTAEDARADAEKARATSESSRASAESTRAQEETTRQGQETGRKDAEGKRVEAESARASSEQERTGSESERKAAEVLRKSAESEREAAEAKRQETENTRKDAEQARASAEALREESEKARVTAESSRVSEHATSHQTATEDHAKITAVLDVIKRLETGEIVAKIAEIESKGATKEEVKKQISDLIGGAPQDLDTLKELADALKAQGGSVEEILTKLGSKADKSQVADDIKQLGTKLTDAVNARALQSDLAAGLAGKVSTSAFDTYKSETAKAIADKAGAAELATLKQQVGDDLQAKIDGKVDKSKVYTGDYSGTKLAEFKPGVSAAPISVASTEKLAAKIIDSLPRPCLTGEDTLKYSEANGTLLYSETPDFCIFPKGKIVSANDMMLTFYTLLNATASLLQGCEYRADDINALADALMRPDFNGSAMNENHAYILIRYWDVLVRAIDALIRSGAFASKLGVLDDIRQIRKLKEDLEAATADSAYLLAAHRIRELTEPPSLTLVQWGKAIDEKAGTPRYGVLAVDEFFAQTYERFPVMMLDVPCSSEGEKDQIFDVWRGLNGQTDKAFNANICTFPRLVFLSVFDAFESTKPYDRDNLITSLDSVGFYFLLKAIAVSRANMSSQNFGRPSEWLVGVLGGILAAMVRYVLTRNLSKESVYYFNHMVEDLAANETTKPILPILRKVSSTDGKPKEFTKKVERAIIALAHAELETEAATKRDSRVNDVLLEFDDHMPMIKKYAHALASGNCLSDDLNSEYTPGGDND